MVRSVESRKLRAAGAVRRVRIVYVGGEQWWSGPVKAAALPEVDVNELVGEFAEGSD